MVNISRLFYGMRTETIFKGLIVGSRKRGRGADFEYRDLFIEIGRSRFLKKDVVVYYRKLFYNIKIGYQNKLKGEKPEVLLGKIRDGCLGDDVWEKDWDKFLFVYFNNEMNRVALFDYKDMIKGELRRKMNGEYYFLVDSGKLFPLSKIREYINSRTKSYVKKEGVDWGEAKK